MVRFLIYSQLIILNNFVVFTAKTTTKKISKINLLKSRSQSEDETSFTKVSEISMKKTPKLEVQPVKTLTTDRQSKESKVKYLDLSIL